MLTKMYNTLSQDAPMSEAPVEDTSQGSSQKATTQGEIIDVIK